MTASTPQSIIPQPTDLEDHVRLLNMLIWGPPGMGKTSLAATAPPNILLLNFDIGGDDSIVDDPSMPRISRKHVRIMDMSSSPFRVVEALGSPTDTTIEKILDADPAISTILIDSGTFLAEKAMELAVSRTGASLEKPEREGYNHRNVAVLKVINRVHAIAKQRKKHFIITGHEGTPHKDERTGIMFTTVALGGQLPILVPAKVGECWYLSADATGRRIVTLVSSATMRPMKSRMFDLTGQRKTFEWTPQMSLDDLYQEWIKSGGKLQVPAPAASAKK